MPRIHSVIFRKTTKRVIKDYTITKLTEDQNDRNSSKEDNKERKGKYSIVELETS